MTIPNDESFSGGLSARGGSKCTVICGSALTMGFPIPVVYRPVDVVSSSESTDSDEEMSVSLTQLLEESLDEEMALLDAMDDVNEEPRSSSASASEADVTVKQGHHSCSSSTGKRPCEQQEPSAHEGSWDELWQQLERQGWRIEYGPRGKSQQVYYMPPGVTRGKGAKNRIDYFDSKKLVMQLAWADSRGASCSAA
eukprot:s75_g24.t1